MSNRLSREEIFDRHFDAVYTYVAFLVAPDRERARDLTQEVFLAAFAALGTFRGECSMLSWLRRIARNRVVSHFRAAASRNDELSMPNDEFAEVTIPAVDTMANEREALVVKISAVMQALPEACAELLQEKYLDGATVRAMAEGREQSEEAVESALARSRAAFRVAWRKKYGMDLEEGLNEERNSNHERQ